MADCETTGLAVSAADTAFRQAERMYKLRKDKRAAALDMSAVIDFSNLAAAPPAVREAVIDCTDHVRDASILRGARVFGLRHLPGMCG